MPLPGSRLRAGAVRVFDASTMERVIDPAVADLQAEGGSVRGYVALTKVITICAVGGGMMGLGSWPADDRKRLGQAILWSSVFIIVLTALQEFPAARDVPMVLLHPSRLRFVYLMPQALVVTLTAGIALGVVTLCGRDISKRLAVAVLALSLLASTASFVNLGWITPAANQAFRVLMAGHFEPAPDISEMTLGDLARRLDTLRADPALANNGFTGALAFNYHIRWALAASPLLYAVLVLSLGDRIRRRWVVALITCLSFFAYYSLLNLLRPWNSGLPAYAAAWSGNLLVLLVSSVVFVSARRRLGRRSQDAS